MAIWKETGRTAVITGGASGIGLATAKSLVDQGLNVVIADRDEASLDAARTALGGGDRVLAHRCDVAVDADMTALRDATLARFGGVHFLMNNAGSGANPGLPWESMEKWRSLLETNLWGVIRGCQAFIPAMIDSGAPGVIVNTGSKQGITKPPGNAAYNLSKAGVLAYTECLAHDLRQKTGGALAAHLLIPGYTFTGMTGARATTKPAGAWTPDEVVDFMWRALDRGDFYILCPDNEVSRTMDEKRIQWAADDLIRNRPALSRWHPDFKDAFAKYMDS